MEMEQGHHPCKTFFPKTILGVVLQALQSENTCLCRCAGVCIPASCALSILLLD